MLYIISKLLLFMTGWKVAGSAPTEKKYIMVVGPHTSAWDFVYAMAARAVLRLNIYYLAKAELFRPPLGFLFRIWGGYPVDRSKHNNLVDAVVDIFNSHDSFAIALAPEGTRQKVERLKTGFYHIAKKAGIPIRMVGLDYGSRRVVVGPLLRPGEKAEEDFAAIMTFFKQFKGKIPELGIT